MKTFICLTFCILCFARTGFGQEKKSYVTYGGELIFSFADIEVNGNPQASSLRFSPFLNLQFMLNKDLSKHFGVFTGLALRNVGYTMNDYLYPDPDPTIDHYYKKIFRSYNLGLPVGIKLGNLDRLFFYGGYEVELPTLYKEKTFENGEKMNKITGWFSPREEMFQHGFLVSIQFPYVTNIKFKYYLSEFHKRNYVNPDGVKPYAGLQSNIWYLSLSFYLFKNRDVYIYNKKEKEKEPDTAAY